MCCDLAGSVASPQHWLRDIARKGNEFLLFSIVLRILQLLITLEPLDRFKWGFQQNVPLQMSLLSNRKWKMSYVRVPTDSPRSHHIYYHSSGHMWLNHLWTIKRPQIPTVTYMGPITDQYSLSADMWPNFYNQYFWQYYQLICSWWSPYDLVRKFH